MPLIFVVGFVLIAYDLLYVVFDVVVVVVVRGAVEGGIDLINAGIPGWFPLFLKFHACATIFPHFC